MQFVACKQIIVVVRKKYRENRCDFVKLPIKKLLKNLHESKIRANFASLLRKAPTRFASSAGRAQHF